MSSVLASPSLHCSNDWHSQAAWMLLAQIAPAAPKFKASFILTYWRNHSRDDGDVCVMERVLTVIKSVARYLPDEDRGQLIDDLKSRLMKFDSPPELIAVTVATLSKVI